MTDVYLVYEDRLRIERLTHALECSTAAMDRLAESLEASTKAMAREYAPIDRRSGEQILDALSKAKGAGMAGAQAVAAALAQEPSVRGGIGREKDCSFEGPSTIRCEFGTLGCVEHPAPPSLVRAPSSPPDRARVQGRMRRSKPPKQPGDDPGSIEWSEHVDAWQVYAKRYGEGQSALRIHERGGFSYDEMIDLLGRVPTTWKPYS